MTKKTRRRFTPEYKEQAVARLSEPGVTCAGLSAELGITSGKLKTWRLELLAAGSATAIAQTKTEATELARLRRDNTREPQVSFVVLDFRSPDKLTAGR